MENRDYIYSCVKKQFDETNNIKPSEYAIKIGEEISKLLKEKFNDYEHEKFIACGSYTNSLSTYICIYGRLKNQVVFYNTLTIEFLSDFLLFHEHRDNEHFLYLFGKYMSKIEIERKSEFYGFYNWLYFESNNDVKSYDFENMYNAAHGMIFVTLHEFTHMRPDLIKITKNLFYLDASRDFFINMDDDIITENACDFVAISMMNEFVNNKVLKNIDLSNLVEYCLFSLYILELYPLLKSLDLNDLKSATININKALEHSLDFINTRFATLVKLIKISQNSNIFSAECDINNIVDEIKKTIICFFEFFYDFLSDLEEYADRYNSLDDNERKQFSNLTEYETWFSLI